MSNNLRTRDGNPFNFVDGIKLEGNDITINLQSYTALRAYSGKATTVRITTPGIAGYFEKVSEGADNGGTVIVGVQKWRRNYDGDILGSWFEIPLAPIESTSRIQACIDAANQQYSITGSITTAKLPPGKTYLVNMLTLKSGVELIGNYSKITPTSDITGRIIGSDIFDARISTLEFVQQPGINYMPVIHITRGSNIEFTKNIFTGVGYGVRTVEVNNVTYKRNELYQVGIYPRPIGSAAGWESLPGNTPGDKQFSAAYTKYGCGLRSEKGSNINYEHNYFENNALFGGHAADITGGSGAFTTEFCNDVHFLGGTAINAPGQGFMAVGDWQFKSIPLEIDAGTFTKVGRGKNIRFTDNYARGCNQEGVTSFGCGQVTITSPQCEDNAMANVEVWSSWNVNVKGQTITNNNPRTTVGAMNVVDSFDVTVQGTNINRSMNSGIRVGGSKLVVIDGGTIIDYGQADNNDPIFSSGVSIMEGHRNTYCATDVTVTNIVFKRAAMANNAGKDVYINQQNRVVTVGNNTAIDRPVTYSLGIDSSIKTDSIYTNDEAGIRWTNKAQRPIGSIRCNRSLTDLANVTLSGGAITAIQPILPHKAVGYTTAPTVLVQGSLSAGGTAAAANAVLTDGVVTDIHILSRGNQYSSPPTITISGGGGSGAQAVATIRNDSIDTIVITNGGSGYTTAPNVQISGGGVILAQASASISGGSISGITIINGGNKYFSAPTITISGGGGSGAQAVANITNRTVTSITITDPGSGYISEPSVEITGGGVSLGSATASISNGVVTGFVVTNSGSGYTGVPTISLTGGNGSIIRDILPLKNSSPQVVGAEGYFVLVNGSNDANLNSTFVDVLLVMNVYNDIVTQPILISSIDAPSTGGSKPPARTYTVTAGSVLKMSMPSLSYSVRVSAMTTANGNISNR